MKRMAAVLMVMGAALMISGTVAQGQTYPGTITIDTPSVDPGPGESFDITVNGCIGGETVSGSFEGQTPSATCMAPSSSGFFIMAAEAGTATLSFTAPTEPGTYTGTVTTSESEATATFTVNVVDTDPPATNGTTVPPTDELPATGSDSNSTVIIASVLLLAGLGLFSVSLLRRHRAAA